MQRYKIERYLTGYLRLKRSVKKLKRKVDEIYEVIDISAVQYKQEPKTQTNKVSHPTEDAAIRVAQIKDDYIKKYTKMMQEMKNIESTIMKVKDEQLSDLLYYRYIIGLTVEQTAEEMNLTERYIYKLTPRAFDAVGEILDSRSFITDDFITQHNELIRKINRKKIENSGKIWISSL